MTVAGCSSRKAAPLPAPNCRAVPKRGPVTSALLRKVQLFKRASEPTPPPTHPVPRQGFPVRSALESEAVTRHIAALNLRRGSELLSDRSCKLTPWPTPSSSETNFKCVLPFGEIVFPRDVPQHLLPGAGAASVHAAQGMSTRGHSLSGQGCSTGLQRAAKRLPPTASASPVTPTTGSLPNPVCNKTEFFHPEGRGDPAQLPHPEQNRTRLNPPVRAQP